MIDADDFIKLMQPCIKLSLDYAGRNSELNFVKMKDCHISQYFIMIKIEFKLIIEGFQVLQVTTNENELINQLKIILKLT